jgi:FG-GAP repeat
VALQGSTLVVGEPGNLEGSSTASRAYVYGGSGSSWALQQTLAAENANDPSEFGQTVALTNNGDTLIIGAPNEDFAEPDRFIGAAYIFERVAGSFVLRNQLKAPLTQRGYLFRFGDSVDVEGSTAIVGSPNATAAALPSAGLAYLFMRAGGAWSSSQNLSSTAAESGGVFGTRVAIAGSNLLITAPGEFGEDSNGGATYAYAGPTDTIFRNGFE